MARTIDVSLSAKSDETEAKLQSFYKKVLFSEKSFSQKKTIIKLGKYLHIYRISGHGGTTTGSGFGVEILYRRLFRFRRGIKPNFLWGNSK